MIHTALAGALLLTLSLGASDPKKPKIDASRLIGKWEPKKQAGTVHTSLTFAKDGKVRAVADLSGQPIELKGTYTIAGDQLIIAITFGEKETPNRYTIKQLEADRLEMTDSKGIKQELRRIKPGK